MTSGKSKFEQDLTLLESRLTADMEKEQAHKLNKLKADLIRLQQENVVKINHSVMELVCAKYLIQKGYEAQIEYKEKRKSSVFQIFVSIQLDLRSLRIDVIARVLSVRSGLSRWPRSN